MFDPHDPRRRPFATTLPWVAAQDAYKDVLPMVPNYRSSAPASEPAAPPFYLDALRTAAKYQQPVPALVSVASNRSARPIAHDLYRRALLVPAVRARVMSVLGRVCLACSRGNSEVPERFRPFVAWAAVAEHGMDNAALDRFGNEIHWDEYGRLSRFGWHVDRIVPGVHGGRYTAGNIQALRSVTNLSLGGQLSAASKSA